MKKLLNFALAFAFVSLPVLLFDSCTQSRKEVTPSPQFANYIHAYTGGVISSNAPIRIELVQSQPSVQINSPIDEALFSFKPSLKGTAYWVSNQAVEFYPDEGQLQQGKLYQAEFKLGKIAVVDSKLRTFAFSFRVERQGFKWESGPCIITEAKPNSVSVKGEIRFNQSVKIGDVEKMFSVNFSKLTPQVEATSDPHIFSVLFEEIPRADREQTLIIEVKGKSVGIDRTVQDEVKIPRASSFYPLSVRPLRQPENGVEVAFSEPLLPGQNVRGLITPSGAGSSYVYQIEDNVVRVFFERGPRGSVGIKIFEGIKSTTGRVIETEASYSVAFGAIPPKVDLPFPGTILPDSKNLILPFRTVNLTAVDIRIIRVFENNILSFMQENTLRSRYEMRRHGRLIQKKTIYLDSDIDIQQDAWYDFSVDLAPLIQQEPGAIYHIDFSFQQAYSIYPGLNSSGKKLNDKESDATRQGLLLLSGANISEKEENFWNQPSAYYYGYNEIDYDQYSWYESDDPTKPSYYMDSDRNVYCNVISTNLGVIAKSGARNKLWITVNDIVTVKPVKDAEIVVYNYQLQPIGNGATDSDGFAMIQPDGKPFLLTAKHKGETSYLRLRDGEENSLSRFDVGGKDVQKGLKGYIYGERGVWRPGDTLFLTFILEDRQQSLPDAHPVGFELYNPQGQFYHKEIVTSGVNRFYSFIIPTKPDDPTGLWNAYIKVGGSSFHKALRIESIKPNRLKINLTIPGNRIDVSQKETQIQLSASWLTGAVAHDLKAKVEMQLTALSAPFAAYSNYTFRNPATDFSSDEFEVFDGTLDSKGDAQIRFKTPSFDYAPGMLNANMVSRVFEPGGDASISTRSVPFSPFATYLGINLNQKKGDWMESDVEYSFDVVSLSPNGEPKNAGDMEYKIYRLGWAWWWEHSSESFASYVNSTSRTPEKSGKVAMKNGKGSIPFRIDYPSWGRYLVYVKDPNGGHATGGVVYVDWPSWRGRAQASDASGVKMLSFTTDKTVYEVGEAVTVMIPSATNGKALVALENGSSVLSRNWVDITASGDTKYTFTVTEEMTPNIYLHISLLQPHAQTVNDLPVRMYGVVPIMVENRESHLFPKIDMPDVLRPETPFTVKVGEEGGRPMTYTLAIVDDGLLDLTNFKTPDPWSEFFAREAIGVRTWDLYDHIIGAFGEKYGALFSIGGDGTLNQSGQKADRFKPVVKFLGPFTLKKGETKSHKLTLPPYVGSVRVMVVAGASGAYGNGAKTVPVRSPLMLLSTLPRVLSIGEEIQLPVNVFAMEEGVKDVHVSVEVSDRLRISGDSFQTLHFSQAGDALCTFNLRVSDLIGPAKVKITATGNGHTASETIDIDVRNPNPIVVNVQAGVLSANAQESFNFDFEQVGPENSVTLELSRIPSVDLKRRYDWIENYEYSCTEQLTSKGFPWLYIEHFKEVDNELSALVKTNVTEAIKYIYGRQLPNGGFLYWPGQSDANEWVTSYAGHFLLKAKERGYEVNQSVIKRWISYQQKVARGWAPQKDAQGSYYYQSDLVQAYRLYTLALANAAETGAMNRLRESSNLSPQAKWRLAAAYAIDGKQKIASEIIFNTASVIESYTSNRYTYGSALRDEAMILETMVLMNDLESSFSQARIISEKLSNSDRFDTQSTVFSLIAMGSLANKVGKGEIKAQWNVNGEKQKEIVSAKPLYQVELPPSALMTTGEVTVTNSGGGSLYARLISKSRPVIDRSPALSHHLKLEVSYTDMGGKAIDPSRLQQGTDFVAVVTVSNISGIDYNDVSINHIIPAGWEVFNERVWQDGEDSASRTFDYQDIRDDRIFTFFDLPANRFKTVKIRLQATYVGKYILPAISCEAMYEPQARARTQAGRVEVVR